MTLEAVGAKPASWLQVYVDETFPWPMERFPVFFVHVAQVQLLGAVKNML